MFTPIRFDFFFTHVNVADLGNAGLSFGKWGACPQAKSNLQAHIGGLAITGALYTIVSQMDTIFENVCRPLDHHNSNS